MSIYRSEERDEAIDHLVAATAGTTEAWTIEALRRDAGPDADLLFPGGPTELIEAWADLADRRMLAASVAADIASTRSLTARVRAIVMIRLDAAEPNRDQVRRALAQLALPANAPTAARITARTVDAIWQAAGDQATGFSWYSKRAILAAIYGATLLYWVTPGRSRDDVQAFLDRRLADLARLARRRTAPSAG
jgi:ubiquinone biosynthesis protein COQ9